MNPPTSADARQMLDTLIRRELKVGDPTDPAAVARALMLRYRESPRAQAIEGEARGMPFLLAPVDRGAGIAVQGATDTDLEVARDAVRADLERLLTDNLGATLRPELEGWQQVILAAIEEGVSNARIGLDPFRRDVAFGVRRQLGEHARLSRLVGQAVPSLSIVFRRLATSLDDVANVLLVLMGEAMADIGFSGGRFLLQVSYGELQARRDAVLEALRRIDGLGVLGGRSHDTWPRGLRAHRQLAALLEAQGQGDLRALLSESELARTLDTLVQQASGHSPRSLRAIGAVAWAPLTRLRRFLQATLARTDPASHELIALQEALQLFIEGFTPAAGFRLLAVGRPAVLNGGPRGNAGDELPARRLVSLVTERSQLAQVADVFTDCRCDDRAVRQAQSLLDRIVFDLDRAIDHYCNGTVSLGLPETRASALSFLIDSIVEDRFADDGGVLHDWWGAGVAGWRVPIRQDAALRDALRRVSDRLRPDRNDPSGLWAPGDADLYDERLFDNLAIGGSDQPLPRYGQVVAGEIEGASRAERDWIPLLGQMAESVGAVDELLGAGSALQRSAQRIGEVLTLVSPDSTAALAVQPPPAHFEVSLERIARAI